MTFVTLRELVGIIRIVKLTLQTSVRVNEYVKKEVCYPGRHTKSKFIYFEVRQQNFFRNNIFVKCLHSLCVTKGWGKRQGSGLTLRSNGPCTRVNG